MSTFPSAPPDSVEIDGRHYKINTDFRVWIGIDRLLRSTSSNKGSRIASCLILAYPELPPSPSSALEELLKFFAGDTQPSSLSNCKGRVNSTPLYDFYLDFDYIYASFLGQYGIDLYDAQLHWWKFRALLSGLNDDCKFARVISYRSINTHDISDSQQRRYYEKMKKLYALPLKRSDDEKEQLLTESLDCLF